MSGPRFHALLPVRDEADIIGQSLRHMLTWVDAIYVFDNGSVDDTWEISLLKFTFEMIQKSHNINMFDFKRRGLIG